MLTLQYGSNHERVYQSKVNIATAARQQTRFFTPLYEVVEDEGKQKLIHYLSAPSGLYAIFTIENGNNGRMNYVLKDHQGSLAALVNEKGSAEYFSFDAWGRRRNAQSWTYENMPASFGSTRGFTMHEHLDEFKLINMNGRVYDPLVGRFLSPDPFVQMPDYSQSYNRYSYAFNNPLRFSDPSGFFAEGDSTVRSTPALPFLPSKKPMGYRPGAMTNTDITSLGPVFKETETTLPIPYLQSKLSNDAEGNANEVPQSTGDGLDKAVDWVIDPLSNFATAGAGIKYTSSNLLRDGYWLGKNGKYYSLTLTQKGTQGWNFYNNSATLANNSVKWLGRFGNALGVLSTAYNGYNFVTNPNWESGIETAVGVGSYFFWEVGAIYYPIKLTSKSALFNYNQNSNYGIDPFMDLRIMK